MVQLYKSYDREKFSRSFFISFFGEIFGLYATVHDCMRQLKFYCKNREKTAPLQGLTPVRRLGKVHVRTHNC
jgi:hypothetical protein